MSPPVYDWEQDDGALAPGADVGDVLAVLAEVEADRLSLEQAVDRMSLFIVTGGLADDYRAWRRAR